MKSKIEKRLSSLEEKMKPLGRFFTVLYDITSETQEEAKTRMLEKQGIDEIRDIDTVVYIQTFGTSS